MQEGITFCLFARENNKNTYRSSESIGLRGQVEILPWIVRRAWIPSGINELGSHCRRLVKTVSRSVNSNKMSGLSARQ